MPVRKLPELLRLLTGGRLTQGAITRDALEQGRRGDRGDVSTSSATRSATRPTSTPTTPAGARAARRGWLMAFETDTATVYQVRRRHRNEEVRERIPADYAGRDDHRPRHELRRGRAGRRSRSRSAWPTCCGRSSEVTEAKAGRARRFGTELKALLKRALALWHERRAGPPVEGFAERVRRTKFDITWHLRDRRLSDRDNQRLLDGLGRCHDAGSLVRFLDDPSIEPTNNRAERALRPAVIARKVSHCTKNARGTRRLRGLDERPARRCRGPSRAPSCSTPSSGSSIPPPPGSPEPTAGSLINYELRLLGTDEPHEQVVHRRSRSLCQTGTDPPDHIHQGPTQGRRYPGVSVALQRVPRESSWWARPRRRRRSSVPRNAAIPKPVRTYPWIVRTTAMVNHYYFYGIDEDFGPFFLKFCTYFPYNAKLCINGHEYVKRQLAKEGIAFEALDNGILNCADPRRLQQLCDGLSATKIDALLRKWLARLPHPFTSKDRAAGYRYDISILQAEFSLTQVLDQPRTGRDVLRGSDPRESGHRPARSRATDLRAGGSPRRHRGGSGPV